MASATLKEAMKRFSLCLAAFFFLFSVISVRADSLLETILPRKTVTAPFHGNIESKIYHAPGCEYYSCKKCTQNFSSAREAEAAGYHPCTVCLGKENAAQKKGPELRGNPNSKVVHGPSCKYYEAKNSTVIFRSRKEAEAAGYHLCTVCNGQ